MAVINFSGPSGPFAGPGALAKGTEKLLTDSIWAPEGTVTSNDTGRRRLFLSSPFPFIY